MSDTPRNDPHPPYRLRASAANGSVAATSSMLRVARQAAIDRHAPTLRMRHSPQQLAFDFYRAGR